MPNLIHLLDASSLGLLYHTFSNTYENKVQFYSIHDCFATTADKSDNLKTLLAFVYTSLYLDTKYLLKFDKDIIDTLEKANYIVEGRTVITGDGTSVELYPIAWILNKLELSKKKIEVIDSKHILV